MQISITNKLVKYNLYTCHDTINIEMNNTTDHLNQLSFRKNTLTFFHDFTIFSSARKKH